MINCHVVSSNIKRIGWKDNTLFIQFNSDECYAYEQADFKVYKEMSEAESVGKHFHRFIRSQLHYTKLDHNPFEPGVKMNIVIPSLSYKTPIAVSA